MPETILLSRSDLASLLSLEPCIEAVEEAFRLHGEGKTPPPGLMHAEAPAGEFHLKAGVMDLGQPYFAAKINGGFFRNRELFGLPNIQGLVLLCDATNGQPLAVMDSKEITVKRTGAATAVAAKYLARPESQAATICGCGVQGMIQLEALTKVLPIRRVFAYARSADSMARFAAACQERFGVETSVAGSLAEALAVSDVVVTCTPSRQPFVMAGDVRPGTFVAAVGADSPDKQELDERLLGRAKVVVDILSQCAEVGELHHAIQGGVMTADDVWAELGQVVAGARPGRTSDEEITVFDSTGTALQDVAAAVLVYRSITGAVRGFDFFG